MAHSDKGCQYGSRKYLEELAALGWLSSMIEELHCYENAMAERLNGILKGEYYLDCCFRTKAESISAVKRVIEIYNARRLHEKLGYKTPAAYRRKWPRPHKTQIRKQRKGLQSGTDGGVGPRPSRESSTSVKTPSTLT